MYFGCCPALSDAPECFRLISSGPFDLCGRFSESVWITIIVSREFNEKRTLEAFQERQNGPSSLFLSRLKTRRDTFVSFRESLWESAGGEVMQIVFMYICVASPFEMHDSIDRQVSVSVPAIETRSSRISNRSRVNRSPASWRLKTRCYTAGAPCVYVYLYMYIN